MHKMADVVENAVDVPLIHIADATAAAIGETSSKRPLLLATRFTMEQEFYRQRLLDVHGIETCVPDEADRAIVHDIIYHELCRGIVSDDSRQRYLEVIERAASDGADGVIFGCTEVGLLLSERDFNLPAFDTTALHAGAAMSFALDAE